MSGTEYSAGYAILQRLRTMNLSAFELSALQRLEEFHGDEHDLRLAASLLGRAGEASAAEDLLRQLAEP